MRRDQASSTARLIAAATCMREELGSAGEMPPSGSARWCEQFLLTSRRDRLLLGSLKWRWSRAAWKMVEAVTLPGIVSHWMRRKRVIDSLVRRAAAEGFSQLIILGAGLDSLGLRMSQSGIFDVVLQADHPATLQVVRQVIEAEGSSLTISTASRERGQQVHVLEADLLHVDITQLMTSCRGFDGTRKTVVVIEGVLMYLPEPRVSAIFRALARLTPVGCRMVGSWMVAQPGEGIGFRGQSSLIGGWLNRAGEPMLWGSTELEVRRLLDIQGWRSVRLIDLSGYLEEDAQGAVGLASERLFVADADLGRGR